MGLSLEAAADTGHGSRHERSLTDGFLLEDL
jgi:hypothetical protein